jgi:2,6-dihydroxypyridine 3-monooxygenase
MSPGPDPRIAVMGGSLGGLTAGVLMRRAGFDVAVFERSRRPLEGRGAGIVLHAATVRAISGDTGRLSARAVRMRYLDAEARVTHDVPCSYRFSSYAAVHQALLDDFDPDRYHLGASVNGFEDRGEKVLVEKADGGTEEVDLLIAADGIGSTARAALAPEVRPDYAGYVGWRGTVVEGELSPATYEIVADAISYCILPNSHILIYPIPGPGGSTEPGERLINWVWYRNCPEGPELDALLTDRRGERQQVAVGAGSVAEPVVEALRADAADALPGPLAEMVARSPEPFVQVVLDVAVDRMAYGRAALIGDAAFALRPHVAAGTAKAAEDAFTLTEALVAAQGDVPAALADWEPPQLALGRRALARTREAGIRSQFENSWEAGDPLPFGLYEDGDSRLQ